MSLSAKLSGRLSLKLVVTILFLTAISAIFGVSMIIQYRNETAMIEDLSERIASTWAQLVRNDLNNYLSAPPQANAVIAISLKSAPHINTQNLTEITPHLYDTISRVFTNVPQLSFVAIGTSDGNYAGVSREIVKNKYTLTLKDSTTGGALMFYTDMEPTSAVLNKFDVYDPRVRPWYRDSDTRKISLWTKAYQDYDANRGVTISYSTPAYDKDNRYIGIITSDIKLNGFNRFLRNVAGLGNSVILILNEENQIISHSTDELTEHKSNIIDFSSMEDPKLLRPEQSQNPLVRVAAPLMSVSDNQSHSFTLNGETYFIRMMSVGNELNLKNWKVAVIVAEKDLIGSLHEDRRTTIIWILCIFASGVILTWFALSKVTTPILSVAHAARLLTRQQWLPVKQDQFELKEIRLLNTAFNDMSRSLSDAFHELEYSIEYDANTALMNRTGFKKWLSHQYADDSHTAPSLSGLVLVNINNTDVIKNSLGDDSLNELYRLISARLQQYIIELDLSVIAVKSADHEFMLAYLTPHEYDYHKLIHVFYESFKLHNDDVLITVNLGYLNRPFAAAKLQEAYTQASIALSAARKQGENTGVAYDKTLDANVGLSTQILTHLNYALEQDELYLHYQPIIALDSERIIGAEVLIRWQSPILGFVSPAQFIPIAEKSGLILPLGSWVLQQACHAVAHKIREQHWPDNFELHVNLSVRQLMQADFVQLVTQCLHDAGLPATNLTLEITESMLIENLSFIDERLRELRQHGIRIAIDDFGTGYSSLSHLYKLSFDCLKVDRIFVSGLLDSQNCAAVLNSVVQLAHGFSVPMVAEGVEKREEAELLRKMGAQKAQGYYFSRPVPLEQWAIDDTTGQHRLYILPNS